MENRGKNANVLTVATANGVGISEENALKRAIRVSLQYVGNRVRVVCVSVSID